MSTAQLSGIRVALSLSLGGDSHGGGPTEAELGPVAAAVVHAIVAAGGVIAYCPRLPLGTLSQLVVQQCQSSAVMPGSLQLVIPEIEYSRFSVHELRTIAAEIGAAGAIMLVDSTGRPFEVDDAPTPTGGIPTADALTALRTYLALTTDARVAIGGKSSQPDAESGIVEECRLSMENGGLVIPVGGFGGASAQVGRALQPSQIRDSGVAKTLAFSRNPDELAGAIVHALQHHRDARPALRTPTSG